NRTDFTSRGIFRIPSLPPPLPSLLRPHPSLGAIEHADIAPDLERALFAPNFRLVNFAVFGIHDRAALEAVAVGAEILENDQSDDGLILVGARAPGADLRLALLVVRLGQSGDLAEEFAALVVKLHHRRDLAALFVDGIPPAGRRFGGHQSARGTKTAEKN